MSNRPAAPATRVRSAATRLATAPTTGPTTGPNTALTTGAGADPALDEALDRISDLAARLWAVRSAHRPVTTGWRRSQTRCAGCGQPVPCATLLAAG